MVSRVFMLLLCGLTIGCAGIGRSTDTGSAMGTAVTDADTGIATTTGPISRMRIRGRGRRAQDLAATPIQATAPYQQHFANHFDWTSIQRVVLMPMANLSPYPRAGAELQNGLAVELQRAGRFEVVVATHDDQSVNSQDVFMSGQFDELEVLRVAREYNADAVLFSQVTQYHPYSRPRVGLSLLMVSPAEGIAIASTSGLWDARETDTANQAIAYFKQTQTFPRSLMLNDRVFESPSVYQRFVCQQVATSLSNPTAGVVPASAMMPPPVDAMKPPEPPLANGVDIPPSPPAADSDFP